jgi:HAD superfamily hydrolase (TIGR01450 family)
MKAIILAAGIGSRLRPITNSKPKTMVEVNGKPMIEYIIESLIENNIHDIVVCTGFESIKLKNHLESNFSNINLSFVENKEYDITNNMYSLYLAKTHLDSDIILMNADLVYDKNIITDLIKQKSTCIAVDKDNYLEESMKLKVENNIVKRISKKITEKESYGSSIDIYKINFSDLNEIINEMKKIIEIKKDRNQWTEVMLDNLFKKEKIKAKPLDINNKKWYEIDNFEDLQKAEILFNNKIKDIKEKKIFFVDRDGTLSLEDNLIEGANEFIDQLKNKGKLFYIMTNNSSRTPNMHQERLKKIGFDININNILVSTNSALDFLKNKEIKNIYFLANEKVSDYILSDGFVFDEENPEALLLTYDDELNYKKLRHFIYLLRKGVPYYATHSDYVCPTIDGDIPDIGSFIELIYGTTGIKPNKIFGKPDYNFISGIIKSNNLSDKDAVIIGDRLYTDIKIAENREITSVLVLSGETKRDFYENSTIKADIIINNITDLKDFL